MTTAKRSNLEEKEKMLEQCSNNDADEGSVTDTEPEPATKRAKIYEQSVLEPWNAGLAVAALNVFLVKEETEERERLKEENLFLKAKLSMIFETAVEKESYYFKLVRFGRMMEHDDFDIPDCDEIPLVGWRDDLKEEYFRNLEELLEEHPDFHLGFNTNCLALSRLYLNLSVGCSYSPTYLASMGEHMLHTLRAYPDIPLFALTASFDEREALAVGDGLELDWEAVLKNNGLDSSYENRDDGTRSNEDLLDVLSLKEAMNTIAQLKELRVLMTENELMKKRLESILNVATFHQEIFIDLVWGGNSGATVFHHPEVLRLNIGERLAIDDHNSWHHGYNVGGSAIVRLFRSLASIKRTRDKDEVILDEVEEEEEKSHHFDSESWWQQQYNYALEEFPMVPFEDEDA